METKSLDDRSKPRHPIFRDLRMIKGQPSSNSPGDAIPAEPEKLSKYREIITYFENAIAQGKYRDGERLPSESEIVRQFRLSRPTVSRAMREMQINGLVERKAGSGSYVRKSVPATKQLTFGVLIPNLGEMEIFDGICSQISREGQRRGCDLLWARVFSDKDPLQAERVCEPYLRKPVNGVFFAPLELNAGMHQINARIAAILDDAGIPVVLLDRDVTSFPQRSKHDLVGIDNYSVGFNLCRHLIEIGCKSICFIAHPLSAATVDARAAGVLGAHLATGLQPSRGWNEHIDPTDPQQVEVVLKKSSPDGIICANDKTAAELMQSLLKLNVKVPKDISVVGIDDVRYARLLHPALTTVHQPCELIGTVAMEAMMDRMTHPGLPPRHIMLGAEMVLRQSSSKRPA
jgi:GntR family transcriptional regulator of arabinose operon